MSDIRIEPPSIRLGPGGNQQFEVVGTADGQPSVEWAVLPASGGNGEPLGAVSEAGMVTAHLRPPALAVAA